MAIDYEPFCCVCGGPFSHIELLNPSELDEEDQYQMNVVYDSQILSSAQSTWIRYFQVIGTTTNLNLGTSVGANQSSDLDLFISAKAEWQYGKDWEINAAPGAGVNGDNGENCYSGSFYPLHSACLGLLQQYTQPQYQNNADSLQIPTTIKNFVDAFTARQDYSSKLHSAAWQSGQQAMLPPGYPWYGAVEWSHLYFGARRFWADPWDCCPGMEFLCANPIHEPQTEQFILICLTYPQSNFQNQSPPTLQLQQSETLQDACPFLRCPQEILRLITSYLPLKSALRLHATNRKLSSRLPLTDASFWHFRALQLHSPWFWELLSPRRASVNGNWKALLQILTTARREILAGSNPYWHNNSTTEDSKTGRIADATADITIQMATPLPSLPLGLKNRQRIWMCLECVGMNGTQRKLAGLADEETIEQVTKRKS